MWLPVVLITAIPVSVALELCGLDQGSFNGSWHEHRISHDSDVNQYCPLTLGKLNGQSMICTKKRHYDVARFMPTVCGVRPAIMSLTTLGKCFPPGSHILFVGDSLVHQQYWAWQCEVERHRGTLPAVTYDVVTSGFLRSDLPCWTECTSKSFASRQAKARPWEDHCKGCGESGMQKLRLPVLEEEWFKNLPNSTRLVVIGTGVWYSAKNMGSDNTSALLFSEMIEAVAPALDTITARGIYVVWLAMPPPPVSSRMNDPSFSWDFYNAKNLVAEVALRTHAPRVHFINAWDALRERRSSPLGPSVTAATKGIHWCNPGRGTVPAWLNQHILHALAMECDVGRVGIEEKHNIPPRSRSPPSKPTFINLSNAVVIPAFVILATGSVLLFLFLRGRISALHSLYSYISAHAQNASVLAALPNGRSVADDMDVSDNKLTPTQYCEMSPHPRSNTQIGANHSATVFRNPTE
jgi:hypothetical protein